MAKLSKSDVEHVARLAKLDLTPKELDKFTKELGSIVDYVGQLSEVDTQGIEPTGQTTGLENVTREDLLSNDSLTSDKALSGTDKTKNGSFVVPGLLENK